MKTRTLMLILLAGLLVLPVVAQEGGQTEKKEAAATQEKPAKQGRWEGIVVRSDKDKKTMTVRQRSSNAEKMVEYDDSTKFVSQEHGSKTVNPIDASQIKDDDRVICLGTYDKKGVLHATMISKRLTQH